MTGTWHPHGPPTDLSEMAQQAAGQAVSELAGPNAVTLFGSVLQNSRTLSASFPQKPALPGSANASSAAS